MRYLLDTNVVSEWASPQPSRRVQDWLNALDEEATFVSSVSIGEVARGILLLPIGQRRERLSAWFEDQLLDRFAERCLPITIDIGLQWAQQMVRSRTSGRTIDAVDAFIAATAHVHSLTLVTRNTRHFADCAVPLVDPWQPSAEPA